LGAQGCDGWGFADILPIYSRARGLGRRRQSMARRRRAAFSSNRQIAPPHRAAFIAAAREMGLPVLADMNGPMQEGAGYVNMSITREGTRASAARALSAACIGQAQSHPAARYRRDKAAIDGSRCTGVTLQQGNVTHEIRAAKEVIPVRRWDVQRQAADAFGHR